MIPVEELVRHDARTLKTMFSLAKAELLSIGEERRLLYHPDKLAAKIEYLEALCNKMLAEIAEVAISGRATTQKLISDRIWLIKGWSDRRKVLCECESDTLTREHYAMQYQKQLDDYGDYLKNLMIAMRIKGCPT